MNDAAQLLKDWRLNPGTSKEVVNRVQSEMGIVFPQDYVELMEWSNGGEDWIGGSYLQLWTMEEIPLYNETIGVAKYAPGVIIFGADGGGMIYGFDTHFDPLAIVEVDAVSIGIEEDTIIHHRSFTEFLQFLHNRQYEDISIEVEP